MRVRVRCLAREHNTMSPARARTRTARSGDQRTNHQWAISGRLCNSRIVCEHKTKYVQGQGPSNIFLSLVVCFFDFIAGLLNDFHLLTVFTSRCVGFKGRVLCLRPNSSKYALKLSGSSKADTAFSTAFITRLACPHKAFVFSSSSGSTSLNSGNSLWYSGFFSKNLYEV